jgi:hypothetical protein
MSGKVFKGLDYQGRHPQAAEAATEVGADEEPAGERFVKGLIWCLVAWLCVGAAAVTVWGIR